MKFLTLLFLGLFPTLLIAQLPYTLKENAVVTPKKTETKKPTFNTNAVGEICNNLIDDDGDGLIDMDDYYCYFNTPTSNECIPSKMLWAIGGSDLMWMNLNNDSIKRIPLTHTEYLGDITWAPNGKLYVSEMIRGEIFEMNPVDGTLTLVGNVQGYDAINGLTSDASSNLYLSARRNGSNYISTILKFNTTTRVSTVVFELSPHNLTSGGDLVFLGNYLYVACSSSNLAKINILTGGIDVINYTGTNLIASYSLTSFGDGYLYLTDENRIYRLDLNTNIATLYASVPGEPLFQFSGTASYGDACQSPSCKPRVQIEVRSDSPYCKGTPVTLKAIGAGLLGNGYYTWELPGFATAFGDSITVFESGTYEVRYHSSPDTCGITANVVLNFGDVPNVTLPNDTIICENTSLLISPTILQDAQSLFWQDSTQNNSYNVQQPGLYWIQATNACGVSRDSIQVFPGLIPSVELGSDTILCPSNSIILRNSLTKYPWDRYTWSTGQQSNTISIEQSGIYWLTSANSCGVSTDSIIINAKDSCSCKPVNTIADVGIDVELCEGSSFLLKNKYNLPEFRYLWNDGSTNPELMIKDTGTYILHISSYCGFDMDTIIVTRKENCSCDVYLPSVFTPNNDGNNDMFRVLCACAIDGSLAVYNRYGQPVFITNDLRKGWDGTYKNILQEIGTYVYFLNFTVSGSEVKQQKKGSFTLLR